MGFLKRLTQIFAGGAAGAPGTSGDLGLYYYVQSHRCNEVVRIRINPMNDLSQRDDEEGYFVRKVAVGKRCYDRIEIELSFDNNRKMIHAEVVGGKLVDEAAYEADQAAHPSTEG